MRFVFAMLVGVALASSQTRINGSIQFRSPDFSSQSFSRPWPVAANLPESCRVGEVFFLNNALLGSKIYFCFNPNVWSELQTSSGLGGGASQTADLVDLQVVKLSDTSLQVGAACSISKPCRVRVGSKLVALTAPIGIAVSGQTSTGTLRIWLDGSGLVVGHNTAAAIQCTNGCAAQTGISEFPFFSVPLAEIPFTNNVFADWTPSSDRRAYLQASLLQPGASGNLSIIGDSSTGAAKVDLSSILDFGGMVATRVTRRGTLAQRPIACEIGDLYYQTDATAGLYHCPSVNQWSPVGSTEGLAQSAMEIQSDGAAVGSRSRLNFTAGAAAALTCSDDSIQGRVTCSFNIDTSTLNSTYTRLGTNNAYSAGTLQDFSAASLRVPIASDASPTANGYLAFDSNLGQLRLGRSSATQIIALRDLATQALTVTRNNAAATGTVLNLLARLDNSGNAVLPATTDTQSILGVTIARAGTTGTAEIASFGVTPCIADGTTAIGDFVVIGTSTAGRCGSGGQTYPLAGQVLGLWLSASTAGQTGSIFLFGPGQQNARSRSVLHIGAAAATVNASSSQYIAPGFSTFDTSHGNRAGVMAAAGSALRLAARTATAQPASGSLACRLRVNDVNSSLTLTIAANQAAGSVLSSGSASWVAGDSLTIHCTNNATASSAAFTSLSVEVVM